MDEELTRELRAMEERINARIDARTETVEISVLTAFHQWAGPAEMRARSHALALRAMDLEIEAHDERLKTLEVGRAA